MCIRDSLKGGKQQEAIKQEKLLLIQQSASREGSLGAHITAALCDCNCIIGMLKKSTITCRLYHEASEHRDKMLATLQQRDSINFITFAALCERQKLKIRRVKQFFTYP